MLIAITLTQVSVLIASRDIPIGEWFSVPIDDDSEDDSEDGGVLEEWFSEPPTKRQR